MHPAIEMVVAFISLVSSRPRAAIPLRCLPKASATKNEPFHHGTFYRKVCASIGRARQIVEGRKLQKREKIKWAVDALEKGKPGKQLGDKADWN